MTTTNLKEACVAYVEHMKKKGQTPSTLGTIQRTLALLTEEMGEDKEVGKILPVHVDKFFKSERATQQPSKDGMKPRAEASVLQIRRITRQALVWWKEAGFSDRVPLPGSERKVTEKKAAAKAAKTDKPKRARKAKAAKHAWTGSDGDAEAKAEQGETVSAMHFG